MPGERLLPYQQLTLQVSRFSISVGQRMAARLVQHVLKEVVRLKLGVSRCALTLSIAPFAGN